MIRAGAPRPARLGRLFIRGLHSGGGKRESGHLQWQSVLEAEGQSGHFQPSCVSGPFWVTLSKLLLRMAFLSIK